MRFKRWISGAAMICAVAVSLAQGQNGWQFECLDTTVMPPVPYSDDYGIIGTGNELMRVRTGVSGSANWGGAMGPCYVPVRVLPAPGRFAFAVGATGSVQTDFDDGLATTTGAPTDPVGAFSFATFYKVDTANNNTVTNAYFGQGGLNGWFTLASRRRYVVLWSDADISVRLTARSIGDVIKLTWDISNQKATNQGIAMRFGAYTGMRTARADIVEPGTVYNQANSPLSTNTGNPKFTPDRYVGFTEIPTSKPVRTERNYMRSSPNFPSYASFGFGQSYPYGLRVFNVPPPEMSDMTPVEQFQLGNSGDLPVTSPGLLTSNGIDPNMRPRVFLDEGPDPLFNPGTPVQETADILIREMAFVQGYAPVSTGPGATRRITQYFRSTWSVGDYNDPYAVVADAPRLIADDPSGQGLNGLTPNPSTIRVYIDNQFADIDKEVALQNVRVTITLGNGLSLAKNSNGQVITPASQIIGSIPPNQISSVDFQIVADGLIFGKLPYSVKIEPVPSGSKTVSGQIVVAATPRIALSAGPNLISIPWTFTDTSLDQVLGTDQSGNQLLNGRDYVAFRWDPDQQTYVPVSSTQRGYGLWLIPNRDLGYQPLRNATRPPDIPQGGLLVNLRPGWNLIGNPYNLAVPLKDLVFVSESNSEQTFTFQELVTLGRISSSLAYYDKSVNRYRYTSGVDDLIQPHTGYWLFVSDGQSIRLSWPPVFLPGLPDSGRSRQQEFKQSDRQWRLQLSARTASVMDSENFVGMAESAKAAKTLSIRKPPMAPQGKLELSIEDKIDGKPTRMASAFTERTARKEWRVLVKSEEAGDVTIAWPNLSTVPKTVRFRLLDKATGKTQDLRMSSGLTVRLDQPGTREFKLQMEPGGASRAIIGNVIVTRPSRDPRAPFAINYTLSSQATTSIRILSGSGKEVFAISRGRADNAGENSATWMMRDNANRAVAPGSYRVEILAETSNGDRVRKIVPINVIR